MTDYTEKTNHPIHPSEILRDILLDREISQVSLAKRLGISTKHMNELISGKVSLTPSMALKMEFALGTPSETWLRLQSNYDIITARILIEKQIEEQMRSEKDLLVQFSNCYTNLQKWNCVPRTLSRKDRYTSILNFFATPSLQLVSNNYGSVKFRKSQKSPDLYTIAGWLRYGERQFRECEINVNFNASLFRSSLDKIKSLTREPIETATKELVDICAEAGVVVVFTPYFSKTYINGSTRWIVPSRPLIQLTERHKRGDGLWFTFFHEATHILKHSKKRDYISWEADLASDYEEKEADEEGRNYLIDPNIYKAFVSKKDFSYQSILKFSEKNGIGADIVAGRLAHEEKIEWSAANPLFQKILIEKK